VCPRICDQAAINYRALNSSAGPAVLGLRAQVDRHRYPRLMQDEIVNRIPNLHVVEASVEDLIIKDERVAGCVLDDGQVSAKELTVLNKCLVNRFLRSYRYNGDVLECGNILRIRIETCWPKRRTSILRSFENIQPSWIGVRENENWNTA
jgi:hypothetical protein